MDYPERKSTRLKDYDYSQNGAYFITICTKNRKLLFGEIHHAPVGATFGRPVESILSEAGNIARKEIENLSGIYENVKVDKFIIMPNHIHMILVINNGQGLSVGGRPQVAPTISRVIQQFKGSVTKQTGITVWQRSFYDHIIRSEAEYLKIWDYIDTNTLKWAEDEYYSI